MARKSTFELVCESYNIQKEIQKINNLFYNDKYFTDGYHGFTFEAIIDKYLFKLWKYKDTCLDVNEYLERANAEVYENHYTTEETIINFLEVIENFVELLYKKAQELYDRHHIALNDTSFDDEFYFLIETLEKRMGILKKKLKGKVKLYPKNAPLEHVLDIIDDEDVQWELIRYSREDLSLSEKRKMLAYFATNLYIEDDKSETDEHIKAIVKKATNILNNLHIRHNNTIGKYICEAFKNTSEQDALKLCDLIYNQMLTIVLMRNQKQYEEVYLEFNKKQKEGK